MIHQLHIKQLGFGILDIIASMLVFSAGILIFLDMHKKATISMANTYQRSQAIWAAHDVLTRIKASPETIRDGYNISNYTASDFQQSCNQHCIGLVCSLSKLTMYDNADPYCSNSLINPEIKVVCDQTPCVPGSNIVVTVSWDDRKYTSLQKNNQKQSFTINMRL